MNPGKHALTSCFPSSATGVDRLQIWEDMRSATPVVKLFPNWSGTLWGRPRSGALTGLHFQTNSLQCTLRGLTYRDNLCKSALALGRQTAGRNILVIP